MGVYGNMMNYFQVQFVDIEYFDMLPLMNSGYDKTKDREGDIAIIETIRGCFQNMRGNQAKTSNGNLITVQTGDVWTETELKLGKFLSFNNFTYRIVNQNEWNREAGFYSYAVEQVTGDDGSLTIIPDYNKGTVNYL